MVLAGGAAESSSLHQIKLVSPLEDIDDWDPDREVRQCDLGLRVRVCCVCVCACVCVEFQCSFDHHAVL